MPDLKKALVSVFEEAGIDDVKIDLKVCTGHWAAHHMLEEAWTDKVKNKAVIHVDVAIRAPITPSLSSGTATTRSTADTQIVQESDSRFAVI